MTLDPPVEFLFNKSALFVSLSNCIGDVGFIVKRMLTLKGETSVQFDVEVRACDSMIFEVSKFSN